MGEVTIHGQGGGSFKISCNAEKTSDGHHSFEELYQHRHALFIALMRSHPEISWRANNNSDGAGMENWFVAGMHLPTGDISYQLPNEYWEALDGHSIATTNCAPEWDGHTSRDVIHRLNGFLLQAIRTPKIFQKPGSGLGRTGKVYPS